MRILVAGKTGQLARALAETSLPAGLGRDAIGRPRLDITDPEKIAAVLDATRPALVINTAAWTDVDEAERQPAAAYAVNRDGAARLALACAERGIPLIHISTDYVFSGAKKTPYQENDEADAKCIYGRSKLEGERAVIRASRENVIVRVSWLHSPFGKNFTGTILRLAGKGGEIPVVDDQAGCPTYAPHAAQALMRIAERILTAPQAQRGIFHMAGRGSTTWAGFARKILAVSRAAGGPVAHVRNITTQDYPVRARRPSNSRLDCSRLEKEYGIILPCWEDGVEQCVTRRLRMR